MNRVAINAVKIAGSAAIDLFLPRRCLVCGALAVQWRAPLCPRCQTELETLKIPGEAKNRLRGVLSVEDGIDAVFGVYSYLDHPVIRGVVHAMKYRGGQSLCERMGRRIGIERRNAGAVNPVDCLIPVPIHSARLRERRYNQSTLLARGLAMELEVPVSENSIQRKRKTMPQTFLDSQQRLENIAGAFVIRRKLDEGLRVGLVDDVVTTGATVSSCARILKEAGAESVTVFCLAVAQTEHLLPPVERTLVDVAGRIL